MNNILNEMIIQRRLDYKKTESFDKKYNIDTKNNIIEATDDLGGFRPIAMRSDFINPEYNGVMSVSFFELDTINKILKNQVKDLNEYIFIDIGSGKGRVLFYNLEQEIIYKKQIGIELDQNVYSISKNNLDSINSVFNTSNTELINMDVFDYKFNKEKTIYFFFQPFSVNQYKNFIKKNEEYLKNENNIIINICPYDDSQTKSVFNPDDIFKRFKLVSRVEYISIYQA